MKNHAETVHQNLVPDPFLILVNNPKQPFHARNSFTNQIFWKRIIKNLLKSYLFLLSDHMSSVCHSYVFVCHSYGTPMYSYVIRMSLVCTRMSSVCHSYIFICHPYVTHMYLYVILMSLVCTRMSSVYHLSVALPWTIKKITLL